MIDVSEFQHRTVIHRAESNVNSPGDFNTEVNAPCCQDDVLAEILIS